MAKKLTKKQQKILRLIKDSAKEMSAQDLHFQLKEQGVGIGLATVYRSLKILKIEGEIQERITPDSESFYSLINSVEHHNHHLNCVHCGESYLMDSCPLNHQISEWCNEQQFKVFYHTLEFFGLCEACQKSV